MAGLPPGVNPSTIPLAPNPNGGPSNFINPPTLNPAILGVGVSLIIVSSSLLAARLITNLKNNKKLGLDDYLCIFAEIGGIAYWAVIYSLGRDGAARHIWDVPVSIITHSFIKMQYVQQTIIAPTMLAAKASILALYVRLFKPMRWFRWTSYALMVFMACFYGANIVVAAAYCIPRNGAPWDATAFARCASPVTSAVVIGTFNVVADIILFVLPFLVISTLQMDRRRRWGLYVVFFVGVLTVISSLMSLVYRVLVFTGTSKDSTWDGIRVAITTFAEVFGTIIVSCSTTLPSFYNHVFAESKLYRVVRSTISRTRLSRSSHPEEERSSKTSKDRDQSPSTESMYSGEQMGKASSGASHASLLAQNGITNTTRIHPKSADSQHRDVELEPL